MPKCSVCRYSWREMEDETPAECPDLVAPVRRGTVVRIYCLISDCDEQPRPGEELCETHQQEWDHSRRRTSGDQSYIIRKRPRIRSRERP